MRATKNEVPKHVGVILDGNRRFAKKLMLKPWKGHEWGAKKVEKLMDWAGEIGIKELTLYSFSMQNMNRPKEEFEYLMKVFRSEFTRLGNDPRLEKEDIKINFIGRIHLFPKDVYEKMRELMDRTKNHKSFIINFAMAYGGREEVVDAVMKLSQDVKSGKLSAEEINEEIFQDYLYTPDEPDLIIRTGGDHRTSNFLIWQSNYSEWFFLEKCWPEFEKEDLVEVVDQYVNRERRFGK
jgi:tritrans,polycis-undecaprenyl-diphosphate synthase [geranylgeranyl-diphosphate specific]